ncbi:MAG TPA: hypothetical protein VFZ21_17225 [Gemmatimonadaceae bacterium]|jgi:hypothetical protein|nr:hypothetical protein [Gemmatimonadaceae bacterium]
MPDNAAYYYAAYIAAGLIYGGYILSLVIRTRRARARHRARGGAPLR